MNEARKPLVKYSRHYARSHSFGDGDYAQMVGFYRDLIAELPADHSARILDIGCGAGFFLHAAKLAGYMNAHGIDTDRGQVELATSRGIEVERMDAPEVSCYLRDHKNEFGAIALMDVLEHVPQSEQLELLCAIHDAMVPGGVFVCQVPNALWSMSAYMRYNDWTHQCLFTMNSLLFVVETAGFQSIRIRSREEQPPKRRSGLAGTLVPCVRTVSRGCVGLAWRIWITMTLGPVGFSHPISPNLCAIAIKD